MSHLQMVANKGVYELSVCLLLLFVRSTSGEQACISCHSKEVEGFAKSGMARSLAVVSKEPDGSFLSAFSNTRFDHRTTPDGVWQSWQRANESSKLRVQYAIGSGNHAVGYLAEIDGHLFQSPISYYTTRHVWDLAPGYEQAPGPDFSRPVTLECLTCHADRPLPIANTLNSFQSPPFAAMAIGCDRCHGPAEAHLRRPVPGSILNPAKLPQAERDSICEQCHLSGDLRIPNPGKTTADFQPGQKIEDVYTVYVAAHPIENKIKVVSHAEQLALSVCARNSSGKLWCGTCHNPHDPPEQPVAYFRERCLGCHAATLPVSHGAPDRNCIGCHMPKRPAKDGGHTAFTDHRITRLAEPAEGLAPAGEDLAPWRPPADAFRDRNLAVALVTEGLQDSSPKQVIEGYKSLNRMEQKLADDPAALTVLGTVLLTAKQPKEAERRFRRALELRPVYAPYEVNVADALVEEGDLKGGIEHLERAMQLDPLLPQAVHLLSRAYRTQGEQAKADQVEQKYRFAMGVTLLPSAAR